MKESSDSEDDKVKTEEEFSDNDGSESEDEVYFPSNRVNPSLPCSPNGSSRPRPMATQRSLGLDNYHQNPHQQLASLMGSARRSSPGPDFIPPPLPLYEFSSEPEEICGPRTGFDFTLPVAPPLAETGAAANTQASRRLRDPRECQALAREFSAYEMDSTISSNASEEEGKEGVLVYSKDFQLQGKPQKYKDVPANSLEFDSFFESGNLKEARWQSDPFQPRQPKDQSDQVYDLWCQNDTHTNGHVQWFYFRVKNGKHQGKLRVRFNIVNMMKKDSLYNFGMRPCILSESSGGGWHRAGQSICWYRNHRTYQRRKKGSKKSFYTLTFSYTFEHPGDTVYFAHCYPYTYSDLQRELHEICSTEACQSYLKRRDLCTTLAGNRCDLLTITSSTEKVEELKQRPGIIITARVHPGESNSSFMMRGFLKFLIADTPEGQALRDSFVFKLVPMLNPDGVINGNYRCSLAGVDLNRRYHRPSCHLHPTISAVKRLINRTQETRGVLLYIDLHGHSRKKNVFLYGCDNSSLPVDQRLVPRVFPRMLSKESSKNAISIVPQQSARRTGTTRFSPRSPRGYQMMQRQDKYFSYHDCSFVVHKSKYSTGRVVAYREFGIVNSFTLESSFCGLGQNAEQLMHSLKPEIVQKFITGKYDGLLEAIKLDHEKKEEEARQRTDDGIRAHTPAPRLGPPVEDPKILAEQSVRIELLHTLENLSRKLHRQRGSISTEEVVDTLLSWQLGSHFGIAEWEDVGAVVGAALLRYCNFQKELDYRRRHSTRNSKWNFHTRRGSSLDVDSEDGPVSYRRKSVVLPEGGGTEPPHQLTAPPMNGKPSRKKYHPEEAQTLLSGSPNAPITSLAVLHEDLAASWQHQMARAEAEVEIRRILKRQAALSRSSVFPTEQESAQQDPEMDDPDGLYRLGEAQIHPQSTEESYNNELIPTLPLTKMKDPVDLEFDCRMMEAMSVSGSDSDPSADNMEPEKLAKNPVWKKFAKRAKLPVSRRKKKKKKKVVQQKKRQNLPAKFTGTKPMVVQEREKEPRRPSEINNAQVGNSSSTSTFPVSMTKLYVKQRAAQRRKQQQQEKQEKPAASRMYYYSRKPADGRNTNSWDGLAESKGSRLYQKNSKKPTYSSVNLLDNFSKSRVKSAPPVSVTSVVMPPGGREDTAVSPRMMYLSRPFRSHTTLARQDSNGSNAKFKRSESDVINTPRVGWSEQRARERKASTSLFPSVTSYRNEANSSEQRKGASTALRKTMDPIRPRGSPRMTPRQGLRKSLDSVGSVQRREADLEAFRTAFEKARTAAESQDKVQKARKAYPRKVSQHEQPSEHEKELI